MLSLLNQYISLRVSLRALLDDTIAVMHHTSNASTTPRTGQLRRERQRTTFSRKQPPRVSLQHLEKELQELACLSTTPQTSSATCVTPDTAPAMCDFKLSASTSQSLTSVRAATTQVKLSGKCVSDYTRDEIAVALLTKFQNA